MARTCFKAVTNELRQSRETQISKTAIPWGTRGTWRTFGPGKHAVCPRISRLPDIVFDLRTLAPYDVEP